MFNLGLKIVPMFHLKTLQLELFSYSFFMRYGSYLIYLDETENCCGDDFLPALMEVATPLIDLLQTRCLWL